MQISTSYFPRGQWPAALGKSLFAALVLLLTGLWALVGAAGPLIASADQSAQPEQGVQKSVAAPAATPPVLAQSFAKAHINWRQFEGQRLHVILSGHPIQGTILGLLPEFKALTGITAQVDVLPEEDFFQHLNIDFEGGKSQIDVFMTAPLYQWRYAAAGCVI